MIRLNNLATLSHPPSCRLLPSPEPDDRCCGDPSGPRWRTVRQLPWLWGPEHDPAESPSGLLCDLPHRDFPGKWPSLLTIWYHTLPYHASDSACSNRASFLSFFLSHAACHGSSAGGLYCHLPVWHSGVRLHHCSCCPHPRVPAQVCIRAGCPRHQWTTLHHICKSRMDLKVAIVCAFFLNKWSDLNVEKKMNKLKWMEPKKVQSHCQCCVKQDISKRMSLGLHFGNVFRHFLVKSR